MRVAFVTAEVAPIAAVGELASAAAGLVAELRRQGATVELLVPDYGGVELADEHVRDLIVPEWVGAARIRSGTHPDVGPVRLVDVPGIARPHPYQQADGEGWPDNAERFFRFARAVASVIDADPPDVVHLNDWHTGAVAAALVDPPPIVLSLHDLAHQGTTDGSWLQRLGPRASHFEWWGGTNPLSGAIALADRIVAVSPHWAEEVLTPEGGVGLDGPLRSRREALTGILKGIDTDLWNPATDPHLAAAFDADSLDAREVNRSALLDRLGLADDGVPLGVVVTALTHQKGIDLLVPLVTLLDQIPMRLAVLGSGDAGLAAHLHHLAGEHADWFRFVEGDDESLSHLMLAGGDISVTPSRSEPCGTTQMQAMRYGAVPVVTATGGLVDTVVDADLDRRGTGFVARRAMSEDLLAALFRAARRVRDRRRLATLQRRIMTSDWSWRLPAAEHLALYADVVGDPGVDGPASGTVVDDEV